MISGKTREIVFISLVLARHTPSSSPYVLFDFTTFDHNNLNLPSPALHTQTDSTFSMNPPPLFRALLLCLLLAPHTASDIKLKLTSKSTIVSVSGKHYSANQDTSADPAPPLNVLAIRTKNKDASIVSNSSSTYASPGFLLPFSASTATSTLTSATISNPSQAFLLPSSSPLCVFTGHSDDIRFLHEKLTDHVQSQIALYSSGDISAHESSVPPPSATVSADSPFARMSAYETTTRISSLVRSADLKVHGLIVAIDERSPSECAVMDCSTCTDIRDWSKGGATAIGERESFRLFLYARSSLRATHSSQGKTAGG